MSLQAYQKARSASEDPRAVEYRLFAEVTRALLDAGREPRDTARLAAAVDWNRRVWTTLGRDCADEGNQLPKETRAAIVSLAMWVGRYSSDVIRGRSGVEALVDINRSIMQGLAQRG